MFTPPRNRPGIHIPLHLVLIVPFVTQVVLTAGLVSYLSFHNGQEAVNNVAGALRGEIDARIKEHLRHFLNTPYQINQLNANALGQGRLDAGDAAALERHFWEQVRVFDSVTSIYFGNAAGGMVNSGREGPGGSQYVIVTDGFARGPFRKYATDDQGRRTELLATLPDFDARTRPWYTGAVARGGAAWSEVYILFTGQDMAIAASRPVYDDRRHLLGVVSVDIFLSQLSSFLQTLNIGETGHSFIIERSGLLIASSTNEKPFADPPGEAPPYRLAASESTVPLIRAAAEALTARFGDYHAITDDEQLTFELDGERQFLQVSPVQDTTGPDWLIVTVIPEADFMGQIRANNRATLGLIGIALLLAVGVGIATGRGITRPITHLNTSVQALAKGQRTQPLTEGGWISEIGQLTQSFNRMAGQLKSMLESLTAEISERKGAEAALQESNRRLEKALADLRDTQDKLVQQERLAAVGQLAAGVAHYFNNALASILGFAELLRLSPETPAAVRADLAYIIESGQRAARLVYQILDFSGKSIRQPKQLDLATFSQETVDFLRRTLPENIKIYLDIEPGAYQVSADPDQLHHLLTNLAFNARDAMPAGGKLRIRLGRVEANGRLRCTGCNQAVTGTWIDLAFADTGGGIPPEVLSHIFEPFFTTREVGQGTGLGLPQVLGIVKQHAGHLTVTSQVGQGSTFTIYLPPLMPGKPL